MKKPKNGTKNRTSSQAHVAVGSLLSRKMSAIAKNMFNINMAVTVIDINPAMYALLLLILPISIQKIV